MCRRGSALPLLHPPPRKMENLEADVRSKLEQVQLLAAENEVLQARERILKAIVDDTTTEVQRLQVAEQLQEAQRRAAEDVIRVVTSSSAEASSLGTAGGAGTPVSGCSDGGGADTCRHSSGGATLTGPVDSGASGASVASAAPLGGPSPLHAGGADCATPNPPAAPSLLAPLEPARAHLSAFRERYCAYVCHVRKQRLAADGCVKPLAAGDPHASTMEWLVRCAVALIPSGPRAARSLVSPTQPHAHAHEHGSRLCPSSHGPMHPHAALCGLMRLCGGPPSPMPYHHQPPNPARAARSQVMSMPYEDSYFLLSTNFITGQQEPQAPDIWARVARAISLT